jgi:uncharacterized protein
VTATLDAALLEGWARAATAALERHSAEIDRINVFPVPDRDTGTNLLLTMRAAAAAVRQGAAVGSRGGAGPASAVETADALARGALRGARGNSGVILSQVLRGVAEAVGAADGACGGVALADALTRAADRAAAAVSRPREGTVLTVLAVAAAAARAASQGDQLDEVAVAAADAARAAVRDTTGQLPELSRAGVVDAGGLGLQLVLDALAGLVADREPDLHAVPPARASHDGRAVEALAPLASASVGAASGMREPAHSTAPCTSSPAAAVRGGTPGPAYEVMYLLDRSDDARAAELRAALDGLGDAVAVVGDGAGTWTVHVHCTDIGAVVEAGVAAGRPHAVRVVPLVERAADDVEVARRFTRERAVVAAVCGPEVAALARQAGADVLVRDCPGPGEPAGDIDEAVLARALGDTGARHVAVLPCDAALAPVAERAAAAARRAGQEVVVLPALSSVAGLAALAVHDPARRVADDVVAMTEAAAGTRSGLLQVAESEALTWAGRCLPGDVLGLVDGEVVLIAPDVSVGALWLASRMVGAGGELVTVLLGDGVADALGESLVTHLGRTHPEVDVVVHRGARPGVPVELGVE